MRHSCLFRVHTGIVMLEIYYGRSHLGMTAHGGINLLDEQQILPRMHSNYFAFADRVFGG